MPFDLTHKVVYGIDAGNVEMWARGVLCDYIRAKLNDPQGPYYAPLQLSPERLAVVTDNGEVASALYSATQSPPVVSVMQEPTESTQWSRTIGGQLYRGKRKNMSLTLDMGIKDKDPTDDNPILEARDDSILAGFVNQIIENGDNELTALGLFNIHIKPDAEKQRAGQGRYPHSVTFFVRTLNLYQPQG